MKTPAFVLFSAVMMIGAIGCGSGVSDTPLMGEVTGVVTFDGNPVVGATVEFTPDNTRDTKGPKSSGVTNAEGKYSLVGPGGTKGAVVGVHKVTIMCPPPAGMSSSLDGAGSSAPTTPCTVPVKYGSLQSTDVNLEVFVGKNDHPIALKS